MRSLLFILATSLTVSACSVIVDKRIRREQEPTDMKPDAPEEDAFFDMDPLDMGLEDMRQDAAMDMRDMCDVPADECRPPCVVRLRYVDGGPATESYCSREE